VIVGVGVTNNPQFGEQLEFGTNDIVNVDDVGVDDAQTNIAGSPLFKVPLCGTPSQSE
jgi:hypothetical protein